MSLFNLSLFVAGIIRDTVFVTLILIGLSILMREGSPSLVRKLLAVLRNLHGVDDLIRLFIKKKVRDFLRQVDPDSFQHDNKNKDVQIPEKGMSEITLP